MNDAEFKRTVTSAIRELTDAHAELTAENFAATTMVTALLKHLHGKSEKFSRVVNEALDEAGEIATNASGAYGSKHTTSALKLIDSVRNAISGPIKPKQDK